MKKLVLLFILLCLSACSVATENLEPTNSVEPSVEPTPTPTPFEDIDVDHHLDKLENVDEWKLDGEASYTANKNVQYINIKGNNEAYLTIDEVYLLEGKHIITSKIIKDGDVEIIFEILNDEDQVVFTNLFSDEIVFENDTKIYSAKIRMHFKSNGDSNIKIENFMINRPNPVYMIRTNQVGFKNDNRKVAYFKGWHGNYFDVVDSNSEEVIKRFGIGEIIYSKPNDEYVAKGDFTDLNIDGTYYLRSSLGYVSYDFNIGQNVYDDLYKDSLKMLTTQRCGSEVTEELSESMKHEKCHDKDSIIQTTKEKIDVRGGWHDAGDYGRYIETGVKALSDLLIAYISNKDVFGDDENIIDSSNGIPDILDEARYELDWFFKMQRNDGAIYSRVVTKTFPGEILPEDDNGDLYVLQVSSASSAGFGAVMALASVAFKDIDQEYSDKCLEAAKKAYKYVSQNEKYNPALPEGFSAGDYNLTSESIYRYYLGVALWFATNDKTYIDFANDNYNPDDGLYSVYWCPLMLYPSYLVLLKGDSNINNYDSVKDNFFNYANGLLSASERDAYRNSLYDNFKWGSNQNVADRAMILLMAYELSGKLEYYDVASEYLGYLLGANQLNYCFVSGYGSLYPKNIHHRITMVKDSIFKGVLVGGPNSSMDDGVVRNKFEGKNIPAPKIYLDDENSYSTNEIAIHFNSSLIYILSYLK